MSVKTDRYEPSLNQGALRTWPTTMERSWCRHAPSAPVDKSNVEGNVRLVYMRVFAELRNETFYSIDELECRSHGQDAQAQPEAHAEEPVHPRGALPLPSTAPT